ncbi:hypothetical protein D3C81_1059340 [compost metagenome]
MARVVASSLSERKSTWACISCSAKRDSICATGSRRSRPLSWRKLPRASSSGAQVWMASAAAPASPAITACRTASSTCPRCSNQRHAAACSACCRACGMRATRASSTSRNSGCSRYQLSWSWPLTWMMNRLLLSSRTSRVVMRATARGSPTSVAHSGAQKRLQMATQVSSSWSSVPSWRSTSCSK